MPRKKKEDVGTAFEVEGKAYTEEQVKAIYGFYQKLLVKESFEKILDNVVEGTVEIELTDSGKKYVSEHRKELMNKLFDYRSTWNEMQTKTLKEAGHDFETLAYKALKEIIPSISVTVVKEENDNEETKN